MTLFYLLFAYFLFLLAYIDLAAGMNDAVVSFNGLNASAQHYGATFLPVPNSGHNLMMEKSAPETIQKINAWLENL